MDITAIKTKMRTALQADAHLFFKKPAQVVLRPEIIYSPCQEAILEWTILLTESRVCLGEKAKFWTESLSAEDWSALTGWRIRSVEDALADGVQRGVFIRSKKSEYRVDVDRLASVEPPQEETDDDQPPPPKPQFVEPEPVAASVAPGQPFSFKLCRPAAAIDVETGDRLVNFTIRQTVKGVIVSLLDGLAARLGEETVNRKILRSADSATAHVEKGEETVNRKILRSDLRETFEQHLSDYEFHFPNNDQKWNQVAVEAGDTPAPEVLRFFVNKIRIFKGKDKPIGSGIAPDWAKFARLEHEKTKSSHRATSPPNVAPVSPQKRAFDEWLLANGLDEPTTTVELAELLDRFEQETGILLCK